MKRIVPFLFAALLCLGCGAQACAPPGLSGAVPAQEVEAAKNGARKGDAIPIAQDYKKYHVADVTAYYTGHDDGLFKAAYQALRQAGWSNPNDALSGVGKYLPKGTQGAFLVQELPNWKLAGQGDGEPAMFSIDYGVFGVMNLAYIEIRDSYPNTFLLIFDIKKDGAYVPVCGVWMSWRSNGWHFAQLGDARFVVSEYDTVYGTGIGLTRCDWYNIDTARAEISYLSLAMDTDDTRCPLGWWTFKGELSQPRITELKGQRRTLIEMDAGSRLEREDNGEMPFAPDHSWVKREPVSILYDQAAHRAYAQDGLSGWYFRVNSEGDDTQGYCAPFHGELSALAGEGNETDSWWAKWMLAGTPDWEAFCTKNGLAYDAPGP